MTIDGAGSSSATPLAGLGRKGFALVAIVALINAIRRTINLILAPPLLDWFLAFVSTFASSLVLGVAILLAVVWTVNRVPRRGFRQYAALAAAVAAATLVGVTFLYAFESDGTFGFDEAGTTLGGLLFVLYSFWMRYFLLGMLMAGAWLYLRAEAEHAGALARCEVDSVRMDQQAAEARLQVLEAQIEPHFLFNTLANVRRLYDHDRAAGARMLGNLMRYLSVALPRMRESASTLGRELDHAIAYLDIHRIRMGRRLAFEVNVPVAMRDAPMPPLMLLTLVENAVKHGLSPLPEGGRIAILAARRGAHFEVAVSDTGRGFTESSGAGTGLANIRARLAVLFGARATLSIAQNAPRGITATLAWPCDGADGSGSR
ncbi:MAG TPA: histidine kinase [Casimicrobiaceae bacterium]